MAPIPEALATALQHHQAGRLQAAEQIYRQVLQADPNQADALHLLGGIAQQVGRHEIAIEYMSRAIALKGNAAEFHDNLAKVYHLLQRLPEAIASYRRALELKPDLAETHRNLGNAFREEGRLADAIACYRKALELKPDFTEAHNQLGIALNGQGRLDDAVACFRRAVELAPGSAGAQNNLGVALRSQGKADESIPCFRRALALAPDLADAHNNLGVAFKDVGQPDESIACFRRALELAPDSAETHNNLAGALLLLGCYQEGWAMYEWRFAFDPPREFSAPRWRHETAEGQTILLHCEQGFGDTLHFLRYAKLVPERTKAKRLILECQPELARLLGQSVDEETEIVAHEDGSDARLPAFDWHLPLLSLPLALGIFEPWPMSEPYLRADPDLRAIWRERLGPSAELKVGLTWKGNSAQERNHLRSMTCDQLQPLLQTPGVRFYNLQVGAAAEEIASLAATGVIDLAPQIDDFADTAAITAELDLIISVDTSLAHLAGALARPVWTLLSFAADWRWGRERESTPWYPTMRLFRQPKRGDWDSVLRRVGEELEAFATAKGRLAPEPTAA